MIKKKVIPHLIVVGFGDLIPYKYLTTIKDAFDRGIIDGYSIVELVSQSEMIKQRLNKVDFKPAEIHFINNATSNKTWACQKEFGPVFDSLIKKHHNIKVFIATEVKAHEEYLKYCIDNNIDSLVEKPIFAPMKKGIYSPSEFIPTMTNMLTSAKKSTAQHSVMTLGRYHKIYNQEMLEPLKSKVKELHAPLTSFHLSTNSGIWNLYSEYETRNDHPYKDGYGMLMHGAYHYVDLMAQFLNLNYLIYPDEKFELCVSAYGAFPSDQKNRIPEIYNKLFKDNAPIWTQDKTKRMHYGETDIVSSFCLKFKKTGKILTVGTISLEQTTPSTRAWKDFPPCFYNKNGRTSCTTIEAQLSTVYSVYGRKYKVPIKEGTSVIRTEDNAEVIIRSNASLLKDSEYYIHKSFKSSRSSDSNRSLLLAWLENEELISTLYEHETAIQITQALGLALQKPGRSIKVDYGSNFV